MNYVNLNAQQLSSDWTDRIGPLAVFSALLVLAILIGYTNFQNGRPFRIESSTSLSPAATLDRLQAQLARDGWHLGYRDDATLIMNIDSSANLGTTAMLGCLSIWFALLHLVSARYSVSVEIVVANAPNGTTIVTNGSKSGSYLKYMAHHLNTLPKD